MSKCTVELEKGTGATGWTVRDRNGATLRQFLDTNGDNAVDQWRYFQDGLEVYRDSDANFNRKPDAYRWFHTAGSRWGIDTNEDGIVDHWRQISAEEVTAEIVAAWVAKDPERFVRLILARDECLAWGLGTARSAQMADRIQRLKADFKELVARQELVMANTEWVQFNGKICRSLKSWRLSGATRTCKLSGSALTAAFRT